MKSLSEIKRRPLEEVVGKLTAADDHESAQAGRKLLAEAKQYGVGLKEFLTLAIDVHKSENPERYTDDKGSLSGWEAALAYLNIPLRDDFQRGVTINLASDTFQTFPGTRALFPEVINDMVQWKYRQENLENINEIIAQSRTVSGVQEITTVVDDDQDTYRHYVPVAELSRIPVKTVRTEEKNVTFYKFGHGIRTSYEFNRRVRLDLLVPFLARTQREIEMSKVGLATSYLINGDGTAGNAAAAVVDQSSFDTLTGETSTNGRLNRKNFLRWLMTSYKNGIYIDTIIGNIDMYAEILELMTVPVNPNVRTEGQNLAVGGFEIGGLPLLRGRLQFALSSTAPDNHIIGQARGETIEELVEAGSLISESERAIENQSVTAYNTENSGFKFIYGDTRSIYNVGA